MFVTVLAGDFDTSRKGSVAFGKLNLPVKGKWVANQAYDLRSDVVELTEADERSGVKVMGAAGWAAAGALVAGPLGAVVGGILGGRGSKVVFVASFKDGKKVMAETSKATWLKAVAARF